MTSRKRTEEATDMRLDGEHRLAVSIVDVVEEGSDEEFAPRPKTKGPIEEIDPSLILEGICPEWTKDPADLMSENICLFPRRQARLQRQRAL